jgi:hypothetical protein
MNTSSMRMHVSDSFRVFRDYLFDKKKNTYIFFAASNTENAYHELIVQNTHGQIKRTIILKLVTEHRKILFTYGGASGGHNRLRRILKKIKKDFEKNDKSKNNIENNINYIQSHSHGGAGYSYAPVLTSDFSIRHDKILTNLEAKKIRCLINTLNNIPYPLTIEDRRIIDRLHIFPKDVLNLIVKY